MVWYGMVWYGMVWYGMVWYGMVWYGMVWYGMVWYGMVWYGMVWYGMVWYGMVWYGMVWYGMVWYGMVWYGMVWYGMVWYGMVWYGMVWYGMVWYGMVWYGMVWYGMVWYGMVWYGMVWYGMVWYGMVWYGMVWYGMVWYGMVWYGMVWYGMVWYGMVWYGMVWYGMVWYGMVWYGMVWYVIGISEVRRREECFTTLQSGHLLYHSKASNGQAGVDFLINRKWKDHIVRINSISPNLAELVMCITKRYKLKTVQVYALITSHLEEDINSFYNDVDETLRKPNHYTIVTGDFNAQIGEKTNPMVTASAEFGLELRNERGDTLAECATSRKYKIMNTMFRKKPGRRWTWKIPNGVTKTKIDYIPTTQVKYW